MDVVGDVKESLGPYRKYMPMKVRGRFLLFVGVLVYFAAYQWVYIAWLYPLFGYLGFGYEQVHPAYLLLACAFCVLPSVWMPMTLTRPSQLIYWVLYAVVYIPSVIAPLNMGLSPPFQIAGLMLTFFAGFAIIGASYSMPLLRIRHIRLSGGLFWSGLVCVALLFYSWIIYVFRGNVRLVSLADVYDLRFGADIFLAGSYVGYAVAWMASVINPFLMGWGLYYRRRLVFLIGAAGQVLLYSTAGMKSILLSVMIIPLFYFLIRDKILPFGLKFVWGLVSLYLLLIGVATLMGEEISEPSFLLLSLVFMRTFGFPGMATGLYHDFFQDFPRTYLSHVNGINWFLDYPYESSIGIEIGSYYSGNPELNANAHFWATDGIAGFGLLGILFVSLFCAIVFWVLDSVADRHNPLFASLVVSFVAINLSNSSLFTSLLSGGFGFLIISLYLLPQNIAES